MAEGDPIYVERTRRFGDPAWFYRPPIQGRDDILRFLAVAKENGMSREKAALYLKARGLLTPDALVAKTPLEKVHERVREGEAAGGLRTVPLPEGVIPPEQPQTMSRFEAGLVGAAKTLSEGVFQTADPMGSIAEQKAGAILGAFGEENPMKAEWRKELEKNAHAARLDRTQGHDEVWSEEALKLMAAEAALDPLTWVPLAGGLSKIGHRLLSVGTRRMFALDLGDAFARGVTEGLGEVMTQETENMIRAVARRRYGDAVARTATAQARRTLEDLEGVGDRAAAAVRTQYGVGQEATLSASDDIVRKFDGEIAETLNTYYDDAVQMELFGKDQLRITDIFDTTAPQASVQRQTVKDLERLKASARATARNQVARLELERKIALEAIKGRTDETLVKARQLLLDDVRKRVDNAMLKFDSMAHQGKLGEEIKKQASEAVNGFVKRTLASETVPSSSSAAAIAKLTADELLMVAKESARPKGPRLRPSMVRRGSIGRSGMPWGFHVARFLDEAIPGQSNLFLRGWMNTAARNIADKGLRKFIRVQIPSIAQRHERAAARITAIAEQNAYHMAAEIKRATGRTGMSYEELGRIMDRSFRAGELWKIPDEKLRRMAQAASEDIDTWSKKLIEAAELPKELAGTIRENLGKYMHLSYAKHHISDWRKRVEGTAIWDEALDWFKKNTNMSDDEIIGTMQYLVSNSRPATFAGALRTATTASASEPLSKFADAVPKPVLDELLKRKTIPRTIQKLMGLEEDFITNYQVTSAKMIYDIEMATMDRQIIKQSLLAGIMTINRTGSNTAEVIFPRVFSKPLWTTPEMAYALGAVEEYSRTGVWNTILGISGAVKFGKVALSPPTIFRNALSLIPMMISNSTFTELVRSPTLMGRSGQMAYYIIKQRIQKALLKPENIKAIPAHLGKKFIEYIDQGLIGTGALGGEMQLWKSLPERVLVGKGLSVGGGTIARRAVSGSADAAAGLYLGLDDLAKITSYEAQLIKLTRLHGKAAKAGERGIADFNSYMNKVYGYSGRPFIKEAAADYTKQTIQHFPYTAQLAKRLSQNPFVAPFASFAAEMPRTQAMTWAYAAKEANWALRNADSPIAGSVARGAALKAVGPVMAANIYLAAKKGIMTEEDSTPEREEAVRETLAAPWQRNSDIIYRFNDDGTITLVDPGYMNPYSETRKLWISAITRPGTMDQKLLWLSQQMEESFLSREIVIESFIETLSQKELGGAGFAGAILEHGRERPDINWTMGGVAEALYHIAKAISPGGINWLDRYVQQKTGKRGFGAAPDKDAAYNMDTWQLVMSFFGFPTTMTIDPAKATYFKFQGHLRDLEELRKSYRSNYRNNPDKEEVDEFHRERWNDWQDDVLRSIKQAKALRVSNREITRQLQQIPGLYLEGGIIRMLIGGQRVPFRVAFEIPRTVIK